MSLDKEPKVSVITACLNAEKYLERAIKSLWAQTYTNIEHIVIDGGSRDGTLKILDRYKDKIARFVSEPDEGIYDAMNKGIRYSTGDILYFFNSDDRFYDKDVIRKVVDFFNRKKTDFVYGDIVNDHLGNPRFSIGRYPRFVTKRHFLKNTIAHPATFFHRSCFEKTGMFDLRYKIVTDYEWYLRALYKYRLRCAHVGQIISIFQCSGASMNKANSALILSEKESIQRLYFSPFELRIGRLLNFFLYWDFLRVAARLILRQRGYRFLSRFKKKVYICE